MYPLLAKLVALLSVTSYYVFSVFCWICIVRRGMARDFCSQNFIINRRHARIHIKMELKFTESFLVIFTLL